MQGISLSLAKTVSTYEVGPSLNWSALQFLKPLHRTSEWSTHALQTPIRPGQFGNAETATFEVFSRLLKVGASGLSNPLTLSSFLLSGIIDSLGDWISQKPYFYLSGTQEKRPVFSETFLTLNACMLWGGLPILFGGVRPASERIFQVASLILEKDKDPDILVMQEVSFEAGLSLWDKIKHRYAHGFTRIGPMPWLALDSGLFIASKHPIVKEPTYIPLSSNGTIKRGVFYFETPLHSVFVTHLEAGEDKEDIEMRKRQLDRIIVEMQKRISSKPCLLLGDLNIKK